MNSTDQITRLLQSSGTSRVRLLQALRTLLSRRPASVPIKSPASLDNLSNTEIHHLARKVLAAPYPLASTPASPDARLRHLLALPPHDGLRAVLLDPPSYAHPEIINALLNRSRARPSSDPLRAHDLAQLALLAASVLPAELRSDRHDALVEGHLASANARRLAGDLAGAESGLSQAHRLLSARCRPRQELAYHTHSASLALDHADCQQAYRHLDRADVLAAATRDQTRQALLLVQRARVLHMLGKLQEADRSLVRSGRLRSDDSLVSYSIYYNRCLILIDLGATLRARSVHRQCAHLFRPVELPQFELLALSERGRLARTLDDPATARRHFCDGQEVAAYLEYPHQVAILDLEMAVAALSEGRSNEVGRLVRRAVPVLAAYSLPQALSVALLNLPDDPHRHLNSVLRRLHAQPFPRRPPPTTPLSRL